jgi:hypothetical protein
MPTDDLLVRIDRLEKENRWTLAATADEFYTMAFEKALERASSQFYQQLHSERTWEQARKPYYNVWPSIVPMLTRLNLDLDSALIQLSPAGTVHPVGCLGHSWMPRRNRSGLDLDVHQYATGIGPLQFAWQFAEPGCAAGRVIGLPNGNQGI